MGATWTPVMGGLRAVIETYVVTGEGQREINGLLKRVLDDEDPRVVFRFNKKKQIQHKNDTRRMAMSFEVDRLIEQHHLSRQEAIALVVDGFESSKSAVERACSQFDPSGCIDAYVAELRKAKLLLDSDIPPIRPDPWDDISTLPK
jgi:hypothetical protein